MRHETFQNIRINGKVIGHPDIGVSDGSGELDIQWTRSRGLYTIWVECTGDYAKWLSSELLEFAIHAMKGQ